MGRVASFVGVVNFYGAAWNTEAFWFLRLELGALASYGRAGNLPRNSRYAKKKESWAIKHINRTCNRRRNGQFGEQ